MQENMLNVVTFAKDAKEHRRNGRQCETLGSMACLGPIFGCFLGHTGTCDWHLLSTYQAWLLAMGFGFLTTCFACGVGGVNHCSTLQPKSFLVHVFVCSSACHAAQCGWCSASTAGHLSCCKSDSHEDLKKANFVHFCAQAWLACCCAVGKKMHLNHEPGGQRDASQLAVMFLSLTSECAVGSKKSRFFWFLQVVKSWIPLLTWGPKLLQFGT